MKIQGKTALVTGASRGIGRAIALELAQQGFKRLLLTDTDMSKELKLFAFVRATTPQRVAQALVKGLLRKDSEEILVGWQSYLAVWRQRLAPWLVDKVLLIAAPQW